jgi:hypothetical protein
MSDPYLTFSLQTIHLMDANLEEDESHYFITEYYNQKILHYLYRFPDRSFDDITSLVNNFTYFCAKVKDNTTKLKYSSNIPIGVFRYVLLEDLSWSPYYTVRRKPGLIVEGAYWSNGMFYQVREDKKEDFDVYEVVLMVDPLTQKMYSFPSEDDKYSSDTSNVDPDSSEDAPNDESHLTESQ